MRARRALLYMPGDDLRKITKATTLGVDVICMDLEDGVAFNRKTEARITTANALQNMDFAHSERLARINPVGSGLEVEDLQAVLPSRPEGIVIPKTEDADQVKWVSAQISLAEDKFHYTQGGIKIIAIIETARGVINLANIATVDPRLIALAFGAEDLAGDIGASRTKEGWEVFFARSSVVLHAAANGLQAIDMVFTDLSDLDGLSKEAHQARQLGYSGKQIIHPSQVDPVQEAFTPTDQDVKFAIEIIAAYEQHVQQGSGVFTWEGKMIEAPMINAAKHTLARAQAAGKLNDIDKER